MVLFPLMCWSVVGGEGEIELVWGGFVVAKWDDNYYEEYGSSKSS